MSTGSRMRSVVNELSAGRLWLQITDERGVPVPGADITAATLTVYDSTSETICNSLTNIDVLDANGGVLTDELSITGITQANPAVVTIADHGLIDGTKVRLDSIAGMTELNSRTCRIRVISDDEFELIGIDSTEFTEYTSGGVARCALLTIQLEGADNPIVGTVAHGRMQTHVAQVELVVNTLTLYAVLEFDVRSLIKVLSSS